MNPVTPLKFEGSFKNKDAQNILFKGFVPRDPKTCVIVVHGMGEHSLKYIELADNFFKKGIAVFLYDQRGHGYSQGMRGHVDRFDDFLDDLKQFTEIVKAQTLLEDIYLVGASMGGLISILFAIRYSDKIKGVVASSPALRLKKPPSGIEAGLAGPLALLFPTLTTTNRVPFEYLTHDAALLSQQKDDKLSLRILSFRLFVEMMAAAKYVFENAQKIKVPVLLLHGTEDNVIDVNGTKEIYAKITSPHKEMKLYEGLYHELLRETDRRQIMDHIASWILKRVERR